AAELAWLASHLVGRTCDSDCRGRVVDYMLTGLGDAADDYAELLRVLLTRPAGESGPSIEKIHARFIRCQIEEAHAAALRDHVLVPALVDALGQPKPDVAVVGGLVGLLAVGAEPTEPVAQAAWNAVLGTYARLSPDRYKSDFVERRAAADAQRQNP